MITLLCVINHLTACWPCYRSPPPLEIESSKVAKRARDQSKCGGAGEPQWLVRLHDAEPSIPQTRNIEPHFKVHQHQRHLFASPELTQQQSDKMVSTFQFLYSCLRQRAAYLLPAITATTNQTDLHESDLGR